MSSGIETIDVHGFTRDKAMTYIWRRVKSAGSDVYRVRVIHGHNGGTVIKDAIWREYRNGKNKVLGITGGDNPGVTELIIRNYY